MLCQTWVPICQPGIPSPVSHITEISVQLLEPQAPPHITDASLALPNAISGPKLVSIARLCSPVLDLQLFSGPAQCDDLMILRGWLVQDFQHMDDKAAWVSSSQDEQQPKPALRLLNPAFSASLYGGSVGLTVLEPSQLAPQGSLERKSSSVCDTPLSGNSYRWAGGGGSGGSMCM